MRKSFLAALPVLSTACAPIVESNSLGSWPLDNPSACGPDTSNQVVYPSGILSGLTEQTLLETCVERDTDGWIDVTGVAITTGTVDVKLMTTIDGGALPGYEIVGGVAQVALTDRAATPLGGVYYAPAGTYAAQVRLSTDAPDATVILFDGTWIHAVARP